MNVWSEKLPFAGYSVVKEPEFEDVRISGFENVLDLVEHLSANAHIHPHILKSSHPQIPAKYVENTGLEPVTSWLQTRRSPS